MKPAPVSERAGKNIGGYHGETIEIHAVLREIQDAATRHGWRQDCFWKSAEYCLLAYHRRSQAARKHVYISTGIHGDEPAGPLAVARLMQDNLWPEGVDVWLCPCLNPTGFPLNRRESASGHDLNRQYRHLESLETRAHVRWLEQQPSFDVSLCLHEDWEAQGFYVYELNPDQQRSFAEEIVRRVGEVCPIDLSSVIEEREAQGGIIRPSIDPRSRPQWPEAFYLMLHKTRLSYTLEAPSDFPLATRVAALVKAANTVLELIAK